MTIDGSDLHASARARMSARRATLRRVIAQTPSSRRAATQERLLEAGRRLIIDKGLGETSVGDICSSAGFTRGAFYSNFTDMDHFVARLATEQWTEVAHFVHSAVATVLADHESGRPLGDEEVAEAIARLADGILAAMPLTRDFYMLENEFTAFLARDPDRAAPVREGYAIFEASMRDLLVSGLRAIGRAPLLDPDDATELVLATAERSMRRALTDGEGGLTDFLERALPLLLVRLSAPTA